MQKSIFTIVLLIVALFITNKIQSFVKNNKPVTLPIDSSDFVVSTTTEIETQMVSTTTDEFATTTLE